MRSSPAGLQEMAPIWRAPRPRGAEQGDLPHTPIQALVVGARVSPGICRSLGLCILGLILILLFGGKRGIISLRSAEMQTSKASCSMEKTQAGIPVKLLELQVCL